MEKAELSYNERYQRWELQVEDSGSLIDWKRDIPGTDDIDWGFVDAWAREYGYTVL